MGNRSGTELVRDYTGVSTGLIRDKCGIAWAFIGRLVPFYINLQATYKPYTGKKGELGIREVTFK